MATAVSTSEIKDAFGQRAWPTLESMEDAARAARRAVKSARNATEDFVAGTTLEVRRHPFAALGVAALAGVVIGTGIGIGAAWFWRNRT